MLRSDLTAMFVTTGTEALHGVWGIIRWPFRPSADQPFGHPPKLLPYGRRRPLPSGPIRLGGHAGSGLAPVTRPPPSARVAPRPRPFSRRRARFPAPRRRAPDSAEGPIDAILWRAG